MTQLTLGYSDSEDRLWLVFTDDGSQLWLTRRMAHVLLLRLAERMTVSCPGATSETSLKPEIRVALEFEAAHETEQDPEPVPQETTPAHTAVATTHLITSITLKVSNHQIHLEAQARGYCRSLLMTRAETHRLLGALARRCAASEWHLTGLPKWLEPLSLQPKQA
jgi:hypothetical protein